VARPDKAPKEDAVGKLNAARTLSMTCVMATLAVLGHPARANPIPTTTDEARTVAGRNLPREGAQLPPAKPYVIVSSSDEARALAGKVIATGGYRSDYAVVFPVTTTDDARAACRELDKPFVASEARK
jgi:hypothetical protein